MNYILAIESFKYDIQKNVKDEGTYKTLKNMLNFVQDEIEKRELDGLMETK